MNIQALIRVASLPAVCGLLLTAVASGAAPEETLRCLAELTSASDLCVDWEADGSRRLVAHRDQGTQNVVEFITPRGAYSDEDAIVRDGDGGIVIDLRSTVWVRTSVLHITDLGTEEVRQVYWLLEDCDGDGEADPPAPGMTTSTGPDGNVAMFVTIRMTQAPATDLDNPNKFYLNPNGSAQFCIAIGAFRN